MLAHLKKTADLVEGAPLRDLHDGGKSCVSQKAGQIKERSACACEGRPGVDYKAPNMCDDALSCFHTHPLFIKLLLRLKQHSWGLLKAKI